jgi:hypothetical protein
MLHFTSSPWTTVNSCSVHGVVTNMNPELHICEVHKLVKIKPKESKNLNIVCGISRLKIKSYKVYIQKYFMYMNVEGDHVSVKWTRLYYMKSTILRQYKPNECIEIKVGWYLHYNSKRT